MKNNNNKSIEKSKPANVSRKDFIKKSLSSSALMVAGSSALLSELSYANTSGERDLEHATTKVGDFAMWSASDLESMTTAAKDLTKTELYTMHDIAYNDGTLSHSTSSVVAAFNALERDGAAMLTIADMQSITAAMDQHLHRNIGGFTSLLGRGGSSNSSTTEVSCCCSCTPCCSCATNVVNPIDK